MDHPSADPAQAQDEEVTPGSNRAGGQGAASSLWLVPGVEPGAKLVGHPHVTLWDLPTITGSRGHPPRPSLATVPALSLLQERKTSLCPLDLPSR